MELVAVLVVAGLAMGLVVISVARVQDKTRFRSAVSAMAGNLRSARNRAIFDRTACTFSLAEETLSGDDPDTARRYGFTCDGTAGQSGQSDRSRSLPAGYQASGPAIAFFPKGYASGGEITIRDGERRVARVSVDPVTGRIYVHR